MDLKKDWVHFLPVIIEFIWSNFIKSQNFFWDGTSESLTWLGYWGYVVWMHWPTQYLISAALIIFYIHKAKKLFLNNSTLIEERAFWIRRILTVMKYYSIIVIIVITVDFLFFDYAFNGKYHYPIFIGMALITYWLGLEGFAKKDSIVLKQSNILNDRERQQLDEIAAKIKNEMEEEKAFKNPELSLATLSDSIGVKSYLTTKCLNIIFEKKFNDFVNSYRIEELKTLLPDPKNKNYTLLSLAFEAGFNSKASFNRAVKKLTGKSPSQLKS